MSGRMRPEVPLSILAGTEQAPPQSDPARKARMAEVERIWLKEALFLNKIE